MLFKDFHEIKVDPDRDDIYDIKNKLLPLLVKMAYKNLTLDKEKHEKKYGPSTDEEEAFNFEFTEDALMEVTDDLVSDLIEKLTVMSNSDIKDAISASSKDFPTPLEKKKK
jgi:hypothetical protein